MIFRPNSTARQLLASTKRQSRCGTIDSGCTGSHAELPTYRLLQASTRSVQDKPERVSRVVHTTRSVNHSTTCARTSPVSRARASWIDTKLPIRHRHNATSLIRRRHFSQTSYRKETHYDVLHVPPTATKSDLKKAFYSLSKSTHPDMNPNDPDAGDRFSKVSEAYSILGNETKRAKYDREVMPQHTRGSRNSSSSGQPRSGTYAGSRPATGLSRRRSQFKGPPPSFYRTAAKDDAEQAKRDADSYAQGFGAGSAGSFDASQYATAGQWDPVFNAKPIYKTQTVEDVKRMSRRAAEVAAAQVHAEEVANFWGRFVVVGGIVAIGVGIGTVVVNMSQAPRGGMVNSKGIRKSELAAAR